MEDRATKRLGILTEASFRTLLAALDHDAHRAAEQYEHLRRSLIKFFDWRLSIYPERDADETIDRLARKLCDGPVDNLFAYAVGVARNVALESRRNQQREQESIRLIPSFVDNFEKDEDSEQRFDCFEACLAQLPTGRRDLILAYYEGDKRTKIVNRQKLADRGGMPIGRLRIQAHRIREKLENCINDCLSTKIDSN